MLFDNHAQLRGRIEKPPVLDHSVGDRRVFRMVIGVKRDSGVMDHLPVNLTENTLNRLPDTREGTDVALMGAVRTRPVTERDGTVHRDIYMLANRVTDHKEVNNQITISGFVRREPVNRITGTQGIEVTELDVEVHWMDKRYFIPVITFKGVAGCAKHLRIGDYVHIIGRLQSRTYKKALENGTEVERTAIEVAAWRCTVPPERLRKAEKGAE